MQAPYYRLLALLLGVSESTTRVHHHAVVAAANELGYQSGGLDTPIAAARHRPPVAATPGPDALWHEVYHLRTACWISIAYLSGMRDAKCTHREPPTAAGSTSHQPTRAQPLTDARTQPMNRRYQCQR